MKTILLMTDFSDNAKNAIRYAIGMFGEDSKYILLNTFIVRENSGSFMSIADRVVDISKEGLKKELDYIYSIFPQYSNLKIKDTYAKGGAIDGITALKEKQSIDLIVMGTKGASGLKKFLIGSVTASVVKGTGIPVLIIPEKAVYKPLEKVVFAADSPNIEDADILNPLTLIIQKFNAELCLLNVIKEEEITEETPFQKIKSLLSPNLQDVKISSATIKGEEVSEAIEAYCEENSVDLLTIVAHHNRFFDRLFHKSVSQELVFHAKLPILALDDSFSD
jgi:nucleotide-binding universal stress UspA family protein